MTESVRTPAVPIERLIQRPRTRLLLARAGWVMLLLVAARLLTVLLPYRLLAPEWYLSAGLELVNTSPVLIVGFLLLTWSTWLKVLYGKITPGSPVVSNVLRIVLQVALWLYLLVIPAQLVASVIVGLRQQNRLQAEWGTVQEKLTSARKQRLGQTQLERLEQIEFQVLTKRGRARQQLLLTLVRDGVRVMASAAAVVWLLQLAGKLIGDPLGLR